MKFAKDHWDTQARQWQEKLRQEGYGLTWVRQDAPGFTYPPHTHPVDTTRIILAGAMHITVNGQTYKVEPGERFTVEKNLEHAVCIGEEGCHFIMGTKV